MKLVLSPGAQADLAGIWDYTVRRWGSDQAERYVRNIEAACTALCTIAHSGDQPSQSAHHVRPGYLKTIVGRHVLYFRTGDDHVSIIRILHQRIDVGAAPMEDGQ